MNKKTYPICFILMACSLFLAHISINRLSDLRREHKLNDEVILKDAPPEIVFTTVALGSFRGLMANWLWIKNIKNQEELRFHESYQIAKLITILQPRYTTAVNHLAWNMAYNISVTVEDPAERWHWVQRGISLIRDEAMRYNNNDPELYHELGWLFSHKIDKNLDDANRYYKIQWAIEMQRIYGNKPDWKAMDELYINALILGDKLEKAGVAQATAYLLKQDLKTLLNNIVLDETIPTQLDKVLTEDQRALLIQYAQETHSAPLEFKTLQLALSDITSFKDHFMKLQENLSDWTKVEAFYRRSGKLPKAFSETFNHLPPKTRKITLDLISNFLKRRWSEMHYRIIPSIALQVEKEISPDLEWRLPQAHAIYWAWRGKQAGHTELSVKCERMIVQSLYSAFQSGKLLEYRDGDKLSIDWTNNLKLADVVKRLNLEAIAKTNSSSFKSGYGNFLKEAILALYMRGDTKKSREYLKEYAKFNNIKPSPDLDSFVSDMFLELYKSSDENEVLYGIHNLLRRSMTLIIYGPEFEASSSQFLNMAKTLHSNYQIKMKKFSEGRQIPSFNRILNSSRKDFERRFPQYKGKLQEMIDSQK
ncbi:hypothetical protein PQO03_02255 [Lentisphaera profundi]|uniref:Uncharacterized protein n=1 Tax=Lentisphaera profundi TaxID=1658616 RepID=A0ABY7VRW4_9BACT|nr:hypothetical protein [Lentisphaera profundi]WDE96782.1 hypothetical protein PQO03_02255 [Lentisphaera profundi]